MIRQMTPLPHHLPLRHRRGQRRYRGSDEKGHRGDEGARLLHRRSVGSRRWRCCWPRRARSRWPTAQVHAGTWKMPSVVPIHRLRGSVLGLVGFGRIPQLVAPKAQVVRPAGDRLRPVRAGRGVRARRRRAASSFAELLKISDYVSIHSPLMPETQRHVQRRGVQADEADGVSHQHRARPDCRRSRACGGARREGLLAGAALDVMTQEPPGARRSSAATTSSLRRTRASTPRSRSSSCRRRRPRRSWRSSAARPRAIR